MSIYDAANKVEEKNPERKAYRGWETSDGFVIEAPTESDGIDYDSMFIVTRGGTVNNFFPTIEQIGQLQRYMPTLFN